MVFNFDYKNDISYETFNIYVGMTLFAIHFFHDFKDLNEQVDDIQIEFDGGNNVFFGGHSFHDHLGVKDDESWN